MGHYLITGLGGSGKSTVHSILQQRGFNSYDTDNIPGLAGWKDLKTGEGTEVDHTGFVDYTKVAWDWDESVLITFLAQQQNVFLCGSASNQLPFHKHFDKVFILMLDPVTHRKHLLERESAYGKDPRLMEQIIHDQPIFAKQALEMGAIAIDATVSPEQTVDEVLKVVEHR